MRINKKLYSVTLASVALILVLILVPSAASAAPLTLTETRISTSGNASNADIYGNTIVWQDTRNGGNPDIYTYNISTKKETRITKSGSAVNPAIYGNLIVWSDGRNKNEGDIYMYDLSSKKETRITKSGWAFNPDIHGSKIVYERSNWSNWDQDSGIFLYDLSTKKVTQIDADSSSNEDPYTTITNTNPVIYGNRIAWEETIDIVDGGWTVNEGLETYNLSTKTKSYLGRYASLFYPDIYNNIIITDMNSNAQFWMYDFSTKSETVISTSEGVSNPRIYGNNIVWGNSLYDLSTKNETQITSSGSASNPCIYGDRIVWQDSRNEGSDIYMATLSSNLPVAAFSASPISGNLPLKVQFSDKSTGSPTSWKWNFGDGKTSTSRNPAHTYTKAGKYTVSLTVKNAAGSSTKTIKNYITVKTAPVKPVAAFSASPTSGYAPLKVKFTDKSANSPTSWKWSFGDGKTSTSKSPTYTYSKAGKYTVSLTVKNAAGSSTKTIKNYIVVNMLKAPVAAFSASPRSGKAPLKVQFTDKSSNSPTSWKWSFGDGTYSTAKNPVHKYSKAGKYTVSLTVKNAKGSSTKTISGYIVVSK